MPKPRRAIRATREPIAPTPTMPTVMPEISWVPTPRARAASQFVFFNEETMARVFRARSSIASTQYSATDCALPPGMFDTITPRAVAAGSGTRSMPVPWIATARTRGAASKMSSGSLLRVMMPSQSAARLRVVSGVLSGERTTSAWRPRTSSPADAIGSTISTRLTMDPRRRRPASAPAGRSARAAPGWRARRWFRASSPRHGAPSAAAGFGS